MNFDLSLGSFRVKEKSHNITDSFAPNVCSCENCSNQSECEKFLVPSFQAEIHTKTKRFTAETLRYFDHKLLHP